MRPMSSKRARGTLAAAGALSLTAVAPAAAATPTTTPSPAGAVAAPKVPGALGLATVRHNVTLGHRVLVTGTLRPARRGRRVQLQVRAAGAWRTVARDTTSAGALTSRVAFAGDGGARAATRGLGRVDVFRRALVSWYGPGLYGGHLACGGRLSPATLGVANKSLPCGTLVTLRHRGRSVRVPVVDRGPYVGAREFDLTSATRIRLGFSGTGTVLTTR